MFGESLSSENPASLKGQLFMSSEKHPILSLVIIPLTFLNDIIY